MLNKNAHINLSKINKKDVKSKEEEILKKMINKIKSDNTMDDIVVKNLEALLNLYLEKEIKMTKLPLVLPNYFIFFTLKERMQSLGIPSETEESVAPKQTQKNQIDILNKTPQKVKPLQKTKIEKFPSNNTQIASIGITAKRYKLRKSKNKSIGTARVNVDHKKLLPAVQTQPCGNCWAVAAAEVLTAYFKQTVDKDYDDIISPQLVMDCVNIQNSIIYKKSKGCEGGKVNEIAKWINELNSKDQKFRLQGLKDYAYHENSLNFNNHEKETQERLPTYFYDNCEKGLNDGDIKLPENTMSKYSKNVSNEELYELLKVRPVLVAIRIPLVAVELLQFSEEDLIFRDEVCGFGTSLYSSGVNHAVALYAYMNGSSGENYWEARNSYGEEHILYYTLKYTAIDDENENACGIRKQVVSIEIGKAEEKKGGFTFKPKFFGN